MKIQFDIYKEDKQWFFDDPAKNILHEKFTLSNNSTLFSTLINDLNINKLKIEVHTVFFFDADAVLEHIEDINQTSEIWYRIKGIKEQLTPSFWKYFKTAPETLWIRILNAK